MTFGVISFHLVRAGLVSTAVMPVVYAAAMGTEAVATLSLGLGRRTGFPAEARARAFDHFARPEMCPAPAGGGLGLSFSGRG